MTDPKPRGFATLSPERLREITSKGGKAVPPEKRAYSQNTELAKIAGTKGGKSVPGERRMYSLNRDLAVASGRKGGRAAQAKRRAEAAGGFEPVGAAVQRVVDQVRSGAKSREDA